MRVGGKVKSVDVLVTSKGTAKAMMVLANNQVLMAQGCIKFLNCFQDHQLWEINSDCGEGNKRKDSREASVFLVFIVFVFCLFFKSCVGVFKVSVHGIFKTRNTL